MSKKSLIKAVACSYNSTNAEAERAVAAVMAGIAEVIQRHGEIRLSGFGTFKVVRRESRVCRHPGSGDLMTIPAREIVKFIPSPQLEEGV